MKLRAEEIRSLMNRFICERSSSHRAASSRASLLLKRAASRAQPRAQADERENITIAACGDQDHVQHSMNCIKEAATSCANSHGWRHALRSFSSSCLHDSFDGKDHPPAFGFGLKPFNDESDRKRRCADTLVIALFVAQHDVAAGEGDSCNGIGCG